MTDAAHLASPAPPGVVVEVQDTGQSRGAIQVAAREARYRGAGLLAIMAYHPEHPLGAPAARPLAIAGDPGQDRLRAEAALRDAVVDALGDRAGQVTLQAVTGASGRALLEAAHALPADLIVLASRDAGPLTPGTVSSHVLRQAPCPVLVVPSPAA